MRRNSSYPDSDRRRWMAYAGAAVLGLAAAPARLIAAQGADEEEEMELSEQFEDLEHRMFGEDGFDDAVKRIAVVEQAFGLSDLNALTASPPPKAAP